MPTQRNDPVSDALDPRLIRLVEAADDPVQLRNDLRNETVRATRELAPDEEVVAADLTAEVLVQLRAQATPPDLAGIRWMRIIDDIYLAVVPVTSLTALAAAPEVAYVEAGRPMYPQLHTSVPATGADRLHLPAPNGAGLSGAGVVVGIIDYGLDFTLDDFRHPDGTTRVAFLWDQHLEPREGEHAPAGFPIGVEYDAIAINKALSAPEPFDVVRHKPDPASHGTHVAGIAAGNGRSAGGQFPAGRFVGAAPEATIIFVQPNTRGSDSTTHSPMLAAAVAYIFGKAAELDLPCVVNISLGQNGGSHDGESMVERAIDRLLEGRGRAVVQAAGNEHAWRGHAAGQLAAEERRTLAWKVGGVLPGPEGNQAGSEIADSTVNELEIWYSCRDSFRVSLVSPSGEETAAVPPGFQLIHHFDWGNVALIHSTRFAEFNGDARVLVTLAPGAADRVEPGTWQVVVEAVESADGRFDAWIERDARVGVLQSSFVDSDVDRTSTLGTPSTTRRGIVVANYDHLTAELVASSSRGPTRDGRQKPDLAAPGRTIWSAHALGGRPGPEGQPYPVRVAKTGTSMSAPHVTGIVALLFERRPGLAAAQVRGILVAAAETRPEAPGFDIGWGYGIVNAERALALL